MIAESVTYGSFGPGSIRKNWGWYLGLGILLIILGAVAITYSVASTVGSMIFLGWLLVFSGVSQGIEGFRMRRWGGFALHALGGVLEMVVGFLVITNPLVSAAALTLVVALYLIVGGLFRTITAFTLGFRGSGWVAIGGLVSFALGVILAWQSRQAGLWFIGTCVGVDLVLHGASWIAFASLMRHVSDIDVAPDTLASRWGGRAGLAQPQRGWEQPAQHVHGDE